MSRRTSRSDDNSPIRSRQQELAAQEAKIRAELEVKKKFIEEAPKRHAQAEERRRQEIASKYGRPTRIDRPIDHKFDLHAGRKPTRTPVLRRERQHGSKLLFVGLLISFGLVLYYAWRVLLHG
jgi:hypothetical protein